MIGKVCAWIYQKGRRFVRDQNHAEAIASLPPNSGPSFNDGLHFHVHDAENGKILQVFNQQAVQNTHFGSSSISSPKNNGIKTYIIPEGENTIEFITRALVEERIK